MPPVISGPRCNRRVTCDASPSNARSESAIAINPLNPYNIVGASKRFTVPATYTFSLAVYASFDGDESWTEAPPLTLLPGWAGTSDPALAWDNLGNVYLVALPFGPGAGIPLIGIAVYKSADGGRTWGPPTLIHASSGDDKQWAVGDGNSTSPHYGNVYAAWDNGSQMGFARTTDHGATWKGIKVGGVDQPAGTSLPGIGDSFSPEINVGADGAVYIVWLAGNQIKFIKSTNGGDSFSAPVVVASGITTLQSALPISEGWPHFPGGTFRVDTFPTGCIAGTQHVVFAWADMRQGVSRIYYRHSADGGTTWLGPASGQPLLTGAADSAATQHDFHPQVISTPAGEIGCAFYEFGPHGGGPRPPQLIDVVLAVSTDHGVTFPNRVTVTDTPWDPAVDAPIVHDTTAVTFIGDYFGLDASRLGFFPFWTDTRTGVQEMFMSRLAVNPADVYIRDSSSDVGGVPSPGNHWEAPDLIVRRQPDGDVTFVNEDLLRDGVTDHYVYARVTNGGPNPARNVRLAVTVGNYPSLIGLPGAEFRYPQDWYPGDWSTPALQAAHLFLGESAATTIASGASKVVGPVVWPAAQIPPHSTWHPCLLAEARADNNDTAGGPHGCSIPADPNPCAYGSYFWGNNNVCQRNLSYAPVPVGAHAVIELPFLVGSAWSTAKYVEVIVDKGQDLARVPMTLRMDRVRLPGDEPPPVHQGEFVLVEGGHVQVRVDAAVVGELVAPAGTVLRPALGVAEAAGIAEQVHGGEREGQLWKLTEPRAAVGFAVKPGELRRLTLRFTVPPTLKPKSRTLLRIFQRNDQRIIAGGVFLEVEMV